MKATSLFALIGLFCAASLQGQQSTTENTDVQRQFVEVRAQAEKTIASPLLPEEAKDHIGETVSVRGLIEQVSVSRRGNVFLNFGARYPRHVFTGFVRAADVDKVGGQSFLRSLSGNPVTVTGRIELFKGKPEIAISRAEQIQK
jgi:DNA/RNA endonuclease YhcR with UshA esterase domain